MDDTTGKFRTTQRNPIILDAAEVMYQRLRLGNPELPEWSELGSDAIDHYCIAAQNCIETFHFEASRNIIVYQNY